MIHLNDMPFLTIGIPFYNNEKTLENAIKSVLMQTYKNWELFLIDDGSGDNSYILAEKYAKFDNRIKLIRDGENRGLVSRLNQIIDLAKGEYIARMDADDIMIQERLEIQVRTFFEKPHVDVIATGAYTIDHNNIPIGVRGLTDIESNKSNIFKSEFLIHPSILVKKDWYVKNRYDKDFLRAEDLELWCRSFDVTRFYRINEPLLLYREGNVNLKNYVLSMNTVRKIIKKYGPDILTRKEINIAVMKTHLKSWTYQVMGIFNLQYLLSSKRNNQMTEVQKERAKKALAEVDKFDFMKA